MKTISLIICFQTWNSNNDLSNGNSNYCTRINLRSDLPPKFVTYTLFKIFKCERNLNIIVCACDDWKIVMSLVFNISLTYIYNSRTSTFFRSIEQQWKNITVYFNTKWKSGIDTSHEMISRYRQLGNRCQTFRIFFKKISFFRVLLFIQAHSLKYVY